MKISTRELIDLKECLTDEDGRLCSQLRTGHEWCFERRTLDSETLEKIEADISEQRKPISAMLSAVSKALNYRHAIERPLPFMPTPTEPSDEVKALVIEAYRAYESEIANKAVERKRTEPYDD